MANSEYDHDVIHRAAMNADAPYNQKTCKNYPWAAAARIRHLERALKDLANDPYMDPQGTVQHCLRALKQNSP